MCRCRSGNQTTAVPYESKRCCKLKFFCYLLFFSFLRGLEKRQLAKYKAAGGMNAFFIALVEKRDENDKKSIQGYVVLRRFRLWERLKTGEAIGNLI